MPRRLLDWDPETGVAEYHDYDAHTDTTTIETVQDVAPILEMNKALANEPEHLRKGMKAELVHVASIPIGVQFKWLKDHGVNLFDKNDMPKIKRLLNSPDYRYLRTTTTRL